MSPNHPQDEQNIEQPDDIMDDTNHPLSSNVEQNVEEEIEVQKEQSSSKDPSQKKQNANDNAKDKQVDASSDMPSFNLFFTPPEEETRDATSPTVMEDVDKSGKNPPRPTVAKDVGKNVKKRGKDGEFKVPMKKRRFDSKKPSPKLTGKDDGVLQDKHQFLRRSARDIVPSGPAKTPYKAPRNPTLVVTPDQHPIYHPFLSPHHKSKKLDEWKASENSSLIRIGITEVDRDFFTSLENMDEQIKMEHVDAILLLLAMRREKDAVQKALVWYGHQPEEARDQNLRMREFIGYSGLHFVSCATLGSYISFPTFCFSGRRKGC
ncbi:hypothetical protein AALP_AA7G121700 [Arabis alpina]|uniref:Uncharacterized protein n=1 Tax=Arabis alpina TaxID=50452 RepID=A0A087GHJ3_ARAAL|nr:hypothetical protein AALP_AA7G121700 [Arabis alpina]